MKMKPATLRALTRKAYNKRCGEMVEHSFDHLTQCCEWCGMPIVHLVDPPKIRRITRDTEKEKNN